MNRLSSFNLIFLSAIICSCSQNPHIDKEDPSKPKASSAANNNSPATNLVVNDRDHDGTPDASDKCPEVPGPAENNGCPYETIHDSDHDGVPDSIDKCPTVPGPAENNGCPYEVALDSDQDGVLNTDDRCPNEKGPKENNGCPYPAVLDADHDGVLDADDKCPKEPGPKENAGCPYSDRDGDGVADEFDACPDQKGPAWNKGCPVENDRDGDGIPDSKDKCPEQAGPASNDGCPVTESDRDHDGVIDSEDKCPDEPGPKSNKGCTYPKEEEKKVLTSAMGSLKFDFDSAVILESSHASLDEVVRFMKKYPESQIKLVGHTDDQGTVEYNQNLSEERTKAVKAYLVENGIEEDRIQASGRGKSEPLVSTDGKSGNELEAARAQNRRVDMSVSYVEALGPTQNR